jgi:hypothetical protein
MARKRVTNTDPGTSTRFGGDDTDLLMGYLSGDDQSSLYPATINTLTTYGIAKLVAPYSIPASYMIYQDSSGRVYALNGVTGAITQTASAPATSAQTTALFNSVFTALQTIGGLVFVRKGDFGPYIINNNVNVGISSSPLVNIIVIAEGWDNTTVQFDASATAAAMFILNCNASVERMTLDGAGKSLQQITCSTPSYINVERVHFKNAGGGITLQTFTDNAGTGCKGQTVKNCWFDKNSTWDQCAIGVVEYALIDGCRFDKRTAGSGANGSTLGSSITSGAGNNIQLVNNKFFRNAADQSPCISLEPYGWAYDRIVIGHNTFENGKTIIGGTGDWTAGGNLQSTTYRNVVIEGNEGNGHIMIVQGPNIALAGQIQDVIMAKNALSLSDTQDIFLNHVQGPISLNGNSLRDSNTGAHAGGGNGLIVVDTCNTVEVSDNILHMVTTNTDNAIKYQFVAGLRFHNNNILVSNGNTGTGIVNPGSGSNTNIQIWDNEGYITNNNGAATITGNGSTTAFNIAHGLAVTPIVAFAQSDSYCFVSAKDGTNITVTFPVAPTSGSHTVYWRAEKRAF